MMAKNSKSSAFDYDMPIDFLSPDNAKQFRLHAISAAQRLKKFAEVFSAWFAEITLHNILFVKYEDMMDPNKIHSVAAALTTVTMRYIELISERVTCGRYLPALQI
jgi:hypothetical protein